MTTRLHPRGTVVDVTVHVHPPELNPVQYLIGLDEHDLRDLEFVLAQRRAMSRRCPDEHGEHTCSLAPGHIPDAGHICRACDFSWPVQEASDGA